MPTCYGAADLGRRSALRIRTRRLRRSVIRLLETCRPEQCGSACLLVKLHVPSAIELSHRASGPAETERCQGLSKGRHNQAEVSSHSDNDRLLHLTDLYAEGHWQGYFR